MNKCSLQHAHISRHTQAQSIQQFRHTLTECNTQADPQLTQEKDAEDVFNPQINRGVWEWGIPKKLATLPAKLMHDYWVFR